jgi:hypothetical protein
MRRAVWACFVVVSLLPAGCSAPQTIVSTTSSDVSASTSDVPFPVNTAVYNASAYCTTPGVLDQSCIVNALSYAAKNANGNTIGIALTANGSTATYSINSTINLATNNVIVSIGAGVTLKNTQTGTIAPMILISGTDDEIDGPGAIDNQNLALAGYGAGVIEIKGAVNCTLNNIVVANVPANANGMQAIVIRNSSQTVLNNPTLPANSQMAVYAPAGAVAVNGGTIGGIAGIALSDAGTGTIDSITISAVHANAVPPSSAIQPVCYSFGDYSSGQTSAINNVSILGGTCGISGTTQQSPVFGALSNTTHVNHFKMDSVTIAGTKQYVSYMLLESGSGGLFTNNVLNVTDASGTQSYGCYVEYGSVTFQNNQCLAFGGGGGGIALYPQVPGGVVANSGNNSNISGNTVVTSSPLTTIGIGVECNVVGSTAQGVAIAGNSVTGPFGKGIDLNTNSVCADNSVSATVSTNTVNGAAIGIHSYGATLTMPVGNVIQNSAMPTSFVDTVLSTQ